MNARFSLRRELVTRLIWPVVVLVAVAGVLAYSIGLHFANLSYDRWLSDAARVLSHQVEWTDGYTDGAQAPVPPVARVALPQSTVDMFQRDELDRIYYGVNNAPSGVSVFGFKRFPPVPAVLQPGSTPRYYEGTIDGAGVRIVVLRVLAPDGRHSVLVRIAETRVKRDALAREILIDVLLYQVLLAGGAAVLIWGGIRSGLQPLAELAREITGRTPADLGPLKADVPQEVRPLVHSLNDLLNRLEASQAAHKRFIADASHQLRTPLSALQIQAERASRESDASARAEALARVNASIVRIAHVANQLLALARADPGSEARQRFTAIDLAVLAREVTTEWVPMALSRGIDLGYGGAENSPAVFGEAQMLKEMLANLIDNALQYSAGTEGAHVTVGVRVEHAPDARWSEHGDAGDDDGSERVAVILFVEDNGPGIPPEARQKVFERFYRLPGSGGRGCGLGLAIVREVGLLHNASVLAESGQEGSGTCMSVLFEAHAVRR